MKKILLESDRLLINNSFGMWLTQQVQIVDPENGLRQSMILKANVKKNSNNGLNFKKV